MCRRKWEGCKGVSGQNKIKIAQTKMVKSERERKTQNEYCRDLFPAARLHS